MRTYDSAAVTLNTVLRLPLGNVYRDTSLLECGRTVRACTVDVILKCRNGKLVTLVSVNGLKNAVYVLYESACAVYCVEEVFVSSVSPIRRDFYLLNVLHTAVDSCVVHVYDSLALLHIGLLSGVLHILLSFLSRDDVCNLEEC